MFGGAKKREQRRGARSKRSVWRGKEEGAMEGRPNGEGRMLSFEHPPFGRDGVGISFLGRDGIGMIFYIY
jgi:hypothetical protein